VYAFDLRGLNPAISGAQRLPNPVHPVDPVKQDSPFRDFRDFRGGESPAKQNPQSLRKR